MIFLDSRHLIIIVINNNLKQSRRAGLNTTAVSTLDAEVGVNSYEERPAAIGVSVISFHGATFFLCFSTNDLAKSEAPNAPAIWVSYLDVSD